LGLRGVWVRDVLFEEARVVVTVALRRRLLVCPDCGFSTASRYDRRPVASSWRHLDLRDVATRDQGGATPPCLPDARGPREAVSLAGAGSRLTRDLEDLVGWLATTMDKAAVCRLVRIDWDTVGRVITRVVDDGLDPDRVLEAVVARSLGPVRRALATLHERLQARLSSAGPTLLEATRPRCAPSRHRSCWDR